MRHNKDDSWRCWTTSRRLVDDLMEVGLKLGYIPAHISTKAARNKTSHDIYCLSFSHRPIRWTRNQWETIDYSGKVWDLTVPNHVFLVRTDGRVHWTGNSAQSKVLYLTADEVIHFSYYTPSELYGYPPVLSIYEKALTLIGMDRYLYDYFYERRVPQGIISTVTDDPKGIENIKSELQARMAQDPHYIPWITVSARTGAGKTEFVRFAYSLDELNYLPVRDEIRERIAGIYGVSNLWMASSQGVGGLNNEQQQLVVMSRVVEGAQRVFHERVFPALLNAFGISDWTLELQKPEEQSEMVDIQVRTAKAAWAATMAQMGFGVEYDQEEDLYTITGRVPSAEEQQQMQQAMAAMGGGMGAGQPGGGFAQGAPIATPEH
jgi:phage portal protein BeeE